jgi:uncharacterized repeat protein (TIGR03803 family)
MNELNVQGESMPSVRHVCRLQAVPEKRFQFSIIPVCVLLIALAVMAAPLHSQTYTDLHDFNCPTEGCRPSFPAILAQGRDGNLYGTMSSGGAFNFGTVFKVTPAGVVTTLYDFNTSGPDGFLSVSGLTLGTDGNFYGTTFSGGANSSGTFFKITPAGALTTLHSFTNTDGFPVAPPVQGANGSYYGLAGGNTLIGSAYSITSAGAYKLLVPALPGLSFAPLILGNDGNFYGTTESGGDFNAGTVFRMSPAGVVKIVYSFDGHANGGFPQGPVVQGRDGFLYGTTSGGGLVSNPVGVVFKLSTAGAITLLHSFDAADLNDGKSPYAGLVAATDGNFYGATTGSQSGSAQFGSIFKITKSGAYSVLHLFDDVHGKTQTATAMQHTSGILYGLPSAGGVGNTGVFYSLAVGIPPSVSLVPVLGTVGQTIGILGKGFTGTTSVKFGAATASFTVVSDTYMTAVVPASGITAAVTVTTPSGALKSKQVFKVVPVVSSFSPASGPVGTLVTITGTAFTGATRVSFGGISASSFTVNSATQIKATVPAGAKTGKIAVQTAGGSGNSKTNFTVTP